MKWEDGFAEMTKAEAEEVEEIRKSATWRELAAACAERWNGDWDSNQLAGMDLCERASQILGRPIE